MRRRGGDHDDAGGFNQGNDVGLQILVIEDLHPGESVVDGFPGAAAGAGDVDDFFVGGIDGDAGEAPGDGHVAWGLAVANRCRSSLEPAQRDVGQAGRIDAAAAQEQWFARNGDAALELKLGAGRDDGRPAPSVVVATAMVPLPVVTVAMSKG